MNGPYPARLLILLGVLVWVTLLPPGAAGQPEGIRQGEEDFAQGRFEEAAGQFEVLVEQAPNDPALLYNLGTAHARAGHKGLAVWHYLRALRLDPRDRDTLENINLLAPGLSQQLAITPLAPANWLYERLTANEWAAVAGGATLGALLLAALYCWLAEGRRRRWWMRRLVGGLVVVVAVAYPFAIVHYYQDEIAWRGVVVAADTMARTGPNEQAIENFSLPEATVVNIEDASGPAWVKISFAGGRKGYVRRDQIKFL